MNERRDWVDYANLASNVAQNVQLAGLNNQMRQFAELERMKEWRAQEEREIVRREDMLRDAVFFFHNELRDVEEIVPTQPAAALVRAAWLKGRYEALPHFKPGSFRSFEDKERLANVQRRCEGILRDTKARLDEQGMTDALTCLDHLEGRAALLAQIASEKKDSRQLTFLQKNRASAERSLQRCKAKVEALSGELMETRVKLAALKNRRSAAETAGNTFGGLMLGGGVLAGGYAFLGVVRDDNRFIATDFAPLVFIGAVFFAGGLVVLKMASAPREAEIEEETKRIGELEKARKRAEAKTRLVADKLKLAETHAPQTLADLEARLAARDQLTRQILGEYVESFLRAQIAPPPPPAIEAYDLVLVECPPEKEKAVIFALDEVVPQLGIDGAVELLTSMPSVVLTGATKEEGEQAAQALHAAGAVIELRPSVPVGDELA